MNTLQSIKKEQQNRVNDLLTNCLVFWAFSNEQFAANKTPLQDGEKYVSIGGGGYMPKGKVDAYLNGMKEINKWFKAATKPAEIRKAHILYELNNYEAFYTGDIEDTMNALGSGYTAAEVWAVYHEKAEQAHLQS